MEASFFASNRSRVGEKMKDFSVLVLFAGRAAHRSADSLYDFTPNRHFYYMTGIDREHVLLLLVKRDGNVEETLFVERPDELAAKWVGERLSSEKAGALSGVRNVKYLDEFEDNLTSVFHRSPVDTVYLSFEPEGWHDNNSATHQFARQVRDRMPYLQIENIHPVITELRTVKSEGEIAEIKKAIDITEEGIRNMLANVKPGMKEYQLEAFFNFSLRSNGVKEHAFPSIVAGGGRATVLHYVENDATLEDGNLVLIDLGAGMGYYSADISRTFPVNGKFTERQREFYEIVLKAELETIEAVKPGITLRELNDVTRAVLARELKRIGKITDDSQLSDYYYHGVSHSLGLDTHDVWDSRNTLKPGHVITIEPGLYIADEGIGIRIEDDVVVTESGCEVLSPNIPKTVEEIESLIQKR